MRPLIIPVEPLIVAVPSIVTGIKPSNEPGTTLPAPRAPPDGTSPRQRAPPVVVAQPHPQIVSCAIAPGPLHTRSVSVFAHSVDAAVQVLASGGGFVSMPTSPSCCIPTV